MTRNQGTSFCHPAFNRVCPGRVDAASFKQGIALSHRFFITARNAAMARNMCHNLAIKEAATFAGPAPEDTVHRWGQPDNTDQVCEV